MAILKIVQKAYTDDAVIDNVIDYCLDSSKMPNCCYGGQGVSLLEPAQSMHIVQNAFCHNYGKRLEHVILAFDKLEAQRASINAFMQLAYGVCEFFVGRQVLFAFHEVNDTSDTQEADLSHLHIHFVISTTNVETGYKDRIDFENVYALESYVEALLWQYDITERLELIAG